MKLAVFSDLHANREATEAVWHHAREQGFDQLVLLGDYVDYGADPAWVMDFVQARTQDGAIALKGNHDEAVGLGDAHELGEHVQASLNWTRARLSSAHRNFIDALPLTAEIENCQFAHANMHDPARWGYIDGRLEAVRSLQNSRLPFVFCGHMHQPCLYHLSGAGKSGEFKPSDGTPIHLSPMRRWLAIPGSVGQPRDGNPAAAYLMFDTRAAQVTFFRVPYDHERAAQRILEAGLPRSLAERLHTGF